MTAAPCVAAAASDPQRVHFRLADKRAKVTEGADISESWQPGRLNHLAALWRSTLITEEVLLPTVSRSVAGPKGRQQDRQGTQPDLCTFGAPNK